jgi:hypothetical protein
MRARSTTTLLLAAGMAALACNAILGLEGLQPAPGDDVGIADGGSDQGGSSGSAAGGGSARGGGGSGGMASGGTAGEGAGGEAGEGAGGEAGSGGGECEPGEEQSCRGVYPTLLGNCAGGTVTCRANGSWGPCSIEPETADSCDDVGDDADCDGTPNGGCPCLSGEIRPCGPATDDGICEFGTSTCVNEIWQTCEDEVLPEVRDCLSSEDNDCDGEPDDTRDAECPCSSAGTHQCVGEAPADWSGPMALATAAATSSSPSCTATGYERQVLSLFGEMDEGSAVCDCRCSTPSGMSCAPSVPVHTGTTNTSCDAIGTGNPDPQEYSVGNGLGPECIINIQNARHRPMPPGFTVTGTCTPQPTANVEDAAWTRRMVACETNDSDPAGCATAELCVPELVNPLERFCIYRTGSHACPAGPYSVQTLYYDGFTDDRACTSCTCGAPSGSCQGNLRFAYGAGGSCGGTEIAMVPYGSCVDITTAYPGSRMVGNGPITPQGQCTPNGGALQGGVVRAGEVTVCCMP